MSLIETIENDLTSAMKTGDTIKADTLKMVKSDLMYEKAKTGKELSEEQVLEVVTRAAKKRREAIQEYKKGNRPDLAKKETDELVVIEEYLPEQLTEKDIENIISEKLKEMGSVTKKDFGQIMGVLMNELKGKADGSLVKDILMKKLD